MVLRKIRNKITLLVAGGIFITLFPLSFLTVQWLYHQALNDLKREALIIADLLSDAVSASVDLEDSDSIQAALETATRRKNIVFMQVYNADEQLLFAYQPQPTIALALPKQVDKPQSFDPREGIIPALHPIPSPIDSTVRIGTFVLGISTKSLEERVHTFRIVGLIISTILFISGNIIAWIIGTNIANPVIRLSEIARRIANGDFAQKATQDIRLTDEIGELARSFDHMRARLQNLLGHIRNAGLMLQASSEGIFMAVNQLAAALEEQSASVIETTATMESMTATSQKISGNTEVVVDTAEQTRTLSQKGVNVAEEMSQKMQEIQDTNTQFLRKIMTLEERSEKIGDVIQIINNIADRTKLIAFNAALEAGSARDTVGKRFHVVAVEIRRLTDTIIESTQEIESTILEMQQGIREIVLSSDVTAEEITEGVHYTETTGNWMREILEAAIRTTNEAKQIATAIQEQQLANEQVLRALKEISDGTRQFADAGNQISESADKMKRLADEFRGLISKFEVL